MGAQPFTVQIAQETLDDLRERLARTRWPDEVAGAGWDYGANLAYMKELVAYWRNRFDWRAQEEALNRFAHFRADVDGCGIHFIHERGKGPNPLPLLLLHGWPSSFVQMLKIIPLLTDPASHGGDPADSFDVIAPSLPGYGFSDRPSERGMSVGRIAGLFATLMTDALGYRRYAARGTDLGAGVLAQLAVTQPDALVGLHLSGTNPYLGEVPEDLTDEEKEFVANAQRWMQTEMAYALEHSSKPQTLAYGLNDSPVGLAAWIIEKFRAWSDCDGDLETVFTKDELLTNLTIYWATETIHSSIRLYYETARDAGRWGRAEVPTATLAFPRDMFPTPRSWVERSGRVDRWTEASSGGHFPEWEVPESVAEDMRAFFRPLRHARGQ
jgi:pimeloyl-ACP methyl ester carboxylesterase